MEHQRTDRHRRSAPLYEARFEHDACGVGFVADAGGRSRERVLPLALAGLAALGHRGAFGADGESSDGAGVALPLDDSVLRLIAGDAVAAGRPAIVSLFLPRGRMAEGRARTLVEDTFAEAGLPVVAWRAVPFDGCALGASAASSRPAFAHAVVARPTRGDDDPRPVADVAFERRLVVARRRLETAARAAGGATAGMSVPSASARTIVYKGLVIGSRLPDLYPDLRSPLSVGYTVFHQRYATNTHPVWRLAQPFRAIAHNGEINTVRGNREQVRGRVGDAVASEVARALLAAGPLLSEDGSDSLSLDEALELLTTTGWELTPALLAAIPEALALRRAPHPHVATLRRRTAGFLAPWDGPAAIVFADGRHVGVLVDRNGLRPAAFAVTRDRLVAVASEAGAVPFTAAETVRRGRLGPGELLLVEPGRRSILEDADAKTRALRALPIHDAARPVHDDRIEPAEHGAEQAHGHALRYLAGLDAERARLDIKTMALEGHEPLWSMGDDTPTPGRGRLDRPVADHLRQAFAQVTNPAIDPERERVVMDLRVELGRRPALLGGLPRGPRTVRLQRPIVVDLDGLLAAVRADGARVRVLDATWAAADGAGGFEAALERLTREAVSASRRGAAVLVLTDRDASLDRLAIPSILATGAVHTALTAAGLRGRTDLAVSAADVLDVHALAMVLAVGATVVQPRLALELAAELAGTRGAETLTPADTIGSMVAAFEAGLRKTLARMGISAVASYIGGALIDVVDLDASVVARCFPTAAAWPGRTTFVDLAERQLRRRAAALADSRARGRSRAASPGSGLRALPCRRRGAPVLAADRDRDHPSSPPVGATASRRPTSTSGSARYRAALARPAADRAVPRDEPPRPSGGCSDAARRGRGRALDRPPLRRLRDERRRAQPRGPPGADHRHPAGRRLGEYRRGRRGPGLVRAGPDGRRHDARIKQVASARFGVTATYLARADQLEIKIAQGSKPGEGGQLPGRKATAYIAALRRGQPGQRYISPPPHHDIYSIEDLAQLIADLRAINPSARIGVKLVAGRGVGHDRGRGRQGRRVVHPPVRPRRRDRGVAALLDQARRGAVGARARRGPPGPAPQRPARPGRAADRWRAPDRPRPAGGRAPRRRGVRVRDRGARRHRLRHGPPVPPRHVPDRDRDAARGPARQVHRHARAGRAVLHRRSPRTSAASWPSIGARSVGEIVGEGRRLLRPIARRPRRPRAGDRRVPVAGVTRPSRGPGSGRARRRPRPRVVARGRLAAALRGQGSVRRPASASRRPIARSGPASPAPSSAASSAARSGSTCAARPASRSGRSPDRGVELRLVGQANDYVGKGLSGGTITVVAEPDLAGDAASEALAGNTCLYGATAGRLHVVGRAGMRFAVRNAGAEAVVEGIGPHGGEYMTGGTLVVLGPVGANFGAGMTGGRAFLYDPSGRHTAALDERSVAAVRLASALADRADGQARVIELIRLLDAHRTAGSALAGRPPRRGRPRCPVLARGADRGRPCRGGRRRVDRPAGLATGPQPDRSRFGVDAGGRHVPSLDATWGSVTPR